MKEKTFGPEAPFFLFFDGCRKNQVGGLRSFQLFTGKGLRCRYVFPHRKNGIQVGFREPFVTGTQDSTEWGGDGRDLVFTGFQGTCGGGWGRYETTSMWYPVQGGGAGDVHGNTHTHTSRRGGMLRRTRTVRNPSLVKSNKPLCRGSLFFCLPMSFFWD